MRPGSSRGLSIIEILVVIGVLAILSTIALQSLRSLNGNAALDADAVRALAELKNARSKTLASENADQYGVRFETDRIIFFKGATYNAASANNVTTELNRLVTIASTTLIGGSANVVFERISGKTQNSGTVILAQNSNTSASTTIVIYETGIAEIR